MCGVKQLQLFYKAIAKAIALQPSIIFAYLNGHNH